MLIKILKSLAIFTILRLFSSIYCRFYSLQHNYRAWRNIKSRWVLVTNATSEIGTAFCDAIAARKGKLILVAENEEKLAKLKQRLETSTKVIAFKINFEKCKNFDFLEKYNIGLVINMIGHESNPPLKYGDEEISKCIANHITGIILISKAVMNYMKDQQNGYIINVSGAYTEISDPFHYTMMTAASAAIKTWSMAIQYELIYDKISVEMMESGYLSLKSNGYPETLGTPSAKEFAESTLSIFGNNYFTVPYFPHFLIYLLLKLLPTYSLANFNRLIFTKKINNF